jgi:hypothetical protein
MDILNPDTWKQQWVAFMTAPYIIGSFIVGAGLIGWWLRGIKSEGKIVGFEGTIASQKAGFDAIISGLNGQIAVFEVRLKLTDEKAGWANEVRDDIARQFNDFKADVAAGAGIGAVISRVEKLEASFSELTTASNAVRSALTGVLNATEGADIANFHGTVE